jgi:hypothetical protein
VDQVVVDRVLRVAGRKGNAEQPLEVGLVLAEERARTAARLQPAGSELVVLRDEDAVGQVNRRRPIIDPPRPLRTVTQNVLRRRPGVAGGDSQ